jgi:hypothetical protein
MGNLINVSRLIASVYNANVANTLRVRCERILRMKIKEIRAIRPLAVFALRVCTIEKLMSNYFAMRLIRFVNQTLGRKESNSCASSI